ncbi:MAG TPA: cytochrome c-type biogenesis CcmF C-terminal domain-containing protein, partial [Alphaproteobacteria bacterium]|nr:cytochrome c-type biogenesis CcmF C-terminal domain-containing protein [Alphaproteobacteria bacterium]
HAFAQSSIGSWFAAFLAIIFVVCLFFFIQNRIETPAHLQGENQLESLVSRESSFLFNNLVLLGACFAVLCGTLFPILSEWIRGYKIAVGAPFFNKVIIPIGLFLIFLTGVGPLLAWRKTSWGSVKRNFAIPAGFATIVAIALVVFGTRPFSDLAHFYAWLSFVMAALVIATIASEFFRGGRVLQNKLDTNILAAVYHLTRRNMRRYGGYVVHFGVVVMLIGIAGTAFNQEKEQEMGLGDKLQIGHYVLTGQEYTQDDNANYTSEAALLEVYKDGNYLGRLTPELRFFKANGGQPDHIVANHSTLQEDLYVIYAGKNPATDHPIIKAFVNPLVAWVWIGVLVVVFGTGLALVPNAAQLKSPVPVAVPAVSGERGRIQPAGVSK